MLRILDRTSVGVSGTLLVLASIVLAAAAALVRVQSALPPSRLSSLLCAVVVCLFFLGTVASARLLWRSGAEHERRKTLEVLRRAEVLIDAHHHDQAKVLIDAESKRS